MSPKPGHPPNQPVAYGPTTSASAMATTTTAGPYGATNPASIQVGQSVEAGALPQQPQLEGQQMNITPQKARLLGEIDQLRTSLQETEDAAVRATQDARQAAHHAE